MQSKSKTEIPVVLFRPSLTTEAELTVIKGFFPTITARTAIKPNDLVIARYACWPWYDSLQTDCDYVGARLINSLKEHRYIADLRNWAEDLGDLTPKTWYRLEDVPDDVGPVVLKGKVFSRKSDWRSHMFANNKKEAGEVFWRLCLDGTVAGEDGTIYVREYVPLVKLMDGLNGLPITNEFRFFCYKQEILCGAYYWESYADDLPSIPNVSMVPFEFLEKVMAIVGHKTNFYVIDVAQKVDGSWILIEVNDGQMSGLSCNSAENLYLHLERALREDHA